MHINITFFKRKFILKNEKLKCEEYWAEDPSKPFETDDFKVSTNEDTRDNHDKKPLIIRSLEVTHLPSKQTRNIIQLQYKAWPDHGIPESTKVFLDLIEKANELNKNGKPFIVHCRLEILFFLFF